MKIKTIIQAILYALVGIPTTLLFLYFGYLAFLTFRYPPANCDNTNPVFENNSYDSRAYKAELIRLLKETKEGKTKFWFSNYVDANHIAVTIQNDKICAKGYLTVDKWEGFMKHLKEVKGKSYGGRLIGLKYNLIDDENKPEIVLLSVRNIAD
jgi:hypothetical protein